MRNAPHVLLVDGDPMMRGLTALLLAKRGAEVSTAGTIEEAVDHAGERMFDVAVIDVVANGPTAATILGALRASGAAPARFVVCTDAAFSAALAPLDAPELVTVVQKPYAFDRLMESVFGADGSRRPTRSGVFERVRPVRTPKRAAQGRRDRG